MGPGTPETARAAGRPTCGGAKSLRAYATWPALGIPFASGAEGSACRHAGALLAKAAGGTELGDLAGLGIADAMALVAALPRPAVPFRSAPRPTEPPAEALRADLSERAIRVRAALGNALSFPRGRAALPLGTGADHAPRAVPVPLLVAAVSRKTGARSADPPRTTVRILRAGGDAGQLQWIAGLGEGATGATRHALPQFADLIDAVDAVRVPFARAQRVRHATPPLIAEERRKAEAEFAALPLAQAVLVPSAGVDAAAGGPAVGFVAAEGGRALAPQAARAFLAVALVLAGLSAEAPGKTARTPLGALAVALAGLAVGGSMPTCPLLGIAELAVGAVVIHLAAGELGNAAPGIGVAEGFPGASLVARADADPARAIADELRPALGGEGAGLACRKPRAIPGLLSRFAAARKEEGRRHEEEPPGEGGASAEATKKGRLLAKPNHRLFVTTVDGFQRPPKARFTGSCH